MKHDVKQTDVIYFQKGLASSTLTNAVIVKSFSYDEYFVIQEDIGSGECGMWKMTSKEIKDAYNIDARKILPNI